MKNLKLKELVGKLSGKMGSNQSIALAAVVCVAMALLIIFFPTGGGEDKQQAEKTAEPVVTKTKIVTAAVDIPARTFIREEMLKMKEVNSTEVPEGAITEINTLIGKPTSANVLQGDVFTDKKFYKDLKMLGFSGVIPADCRAITVPISDITAVAGFLKPGDYVDVMLVNVGEGGASGEILLQNVLLLAINKNGNKPDPNAPQEQQQQQNDQNKDGKDKEKQQQPQGGLNASTEEMSMATLALTPPEALQLAAKSRQGLVYLSLRPFKPSDVFVTDTEYKDAAALAAEAKKEAAAKPAATPAPAAKTTPAPAPSYTPPAATAAKPAPAPAPKESVEVIRGVEKSTVGVN